MLHTLTVDRAGPIQHASVEFGDLTVLVGPQASGKSIFLQLLKLAVDNGKVLETLKTHGLQWESPDAFLEVYLGEGMGSIWSERSSITWDGEAFDLSNRVSRQRKNKEQRAFFIPAQRVLTLQNGWPRNFMNYSAGDPFVVRDFSESTRQLMEGQLGKEGSLFPKTGRLKRELRDELDKTVFKKFSLKISKQGAQKRLVLSSQNNDRELPFMVWSAGQREFVPLLLGLYWLLPPTKVSRRDHIEWVIIEELEMGLHPHAISTVMLLVLELMSRGYRVCLSTHTPRVLDLVWAIRVLRECRAEPERVLELFDVSATAGLKALAKTVLEKCLKVFYFDSQSGQAKDISMLDPEADDLDESEWGRLLTFSSRTSDLVADVVSNAN